MNEISNRSDGMLNTPKPLHLLTIPAEIRTMIFDKLFGDRLELFSHRESKAPLQFRKRFGEPREYVRPLKGLAAITAVCRQLRDEAMPMLVKRVGVIHLEGSGTEFPIICVPPAQPIVQKMSNAQVLYCIPQRLKEIQHYTSSLPKLHTLVLSGFDVNAFWAGSIIARHVTNKEIYYSEKDTERSNLIASNRLAIARDYAYHSNYKVVVHHQEKGWVELFTGKSVTCPFVNWN